MNFYRQFQGGVFSVDPFCYLCFTFVFIILSCLFQAALWSPAGKGLTSWLSCVWCFPVFLSLYHMVSQVRCSTWLHRFLISAFFTFMILWSAAEFGLESLAVRLVWCCQIIIHWPDKLIIKYIIDCKIDQVRRVTLNWADNTPKYLQITKPTQLTSYVYSSYWALWIQWHLHKRRFRR